MRVLRSAAMTQLVGSGIGRVDRLFDVLHDLRFPCGDDRPAFGDGGAVELDVGMFARGFASEFGGETCCAFSRSACSRLATRPACSAA
jgi:hypothetical protein